MAEPVTSPRQSLESVLADFDGRKDALKAFCDRTRTLIEKSLQHAKVPYQSVQARVKHKEKLKQKYENPNKEYRCLDDITDLAALRIITYYEDDVDRAAEVIKREFDIDLEKSVDKRETDPDKFGYFGLNYVGRHIARRREDVEYQEFSAITCEIQITSVLRHAWSEMEHDWYDMGSDYPDAVKRRFYRLAALLELAEAEFLDIKKGKAAYRQSIAIQVEARVPDIPLDMLSLQSLIEQDQLIAETDRASAAAAGISLGAGIRVDSLMTPLKEAGISKVQQLQELLKKFARAVPRYIAACVPLWKEQMSRTYGKDLPTSYAPPGFSIYHLCTMLVALEGESRLRALLGKLLSSLTITDEDVARQVSIAREAVAEQSEKRQ